MKKIIHHTEVENIGLGFIVMCISAVVNIVISTRLYKVAKETESIALEADALHLKTDVFTSFGVAAGLVLLYITKVHILDPIIAILVAMLILKESYELFNKAYAPLLDISLPKKEMQIIKTVIDKHCIGNVSYHGLRTRKAGNYNYVDFHLNLDENITVKQAHEFCDTIENDIKANLKNTEVTIHVENF
jgi:cation diffusion facilitator family transporter